ncbi:MAG: hypothetical protein CME06_07000 [Gemmatimonadetes bacterium]|nr:hypothetical protein [Gemmatimonadota bacterium]
MRTRLPTAALPALLICALPTAAHPQNTPIFPDLEGSELLEALVDSYKPWSTPGYDDARDILYGDIDNDQDSLKGVYTGFTVYIDPWGDPSDEAYQGGIDTEHTWPQSKGANGQAKSDMHHLYPTRIQANGARGSDPFDELPDDLTDKWWRLDSFLTSIPGSLIEEYSEQENDDDLFEPREDHKGNVARSMFYFYTMYKDEADAADASFFPRQKDVLGVWHSLDPVDSDEISRTNQIANHQSGRPNPFVIDTTLVRRAYFPTSIDAGEESGSPGPPESIVRSFAASPNPFNPHVEISFALEERSAVVLGLFDLAGQRVVTLLAGEQRSAGEHRIEWDAGTRSGGVYLCRLGTEDGWTETLKLILLK